MSGTRADDAPEAAAHPAGKRPVLINATLSALIVALNLTVFFAVPLLLLPIDPRFGWLLLPAVLLTPTHWALIHEAVHGVLLEDRRWNERAGRTLAVAFGSPFQLLRLGHLMHHRFNRSEINRPEVLRAEADSEPTLRERAIYYVRLLGGLYLGELLAAPLSAAPDRFARLIVAIAFEEEASDGRTMRNAARRQLLEEPGRSRMRLDGAVITVLLLLSALAFGAFWWMLALALVGRGLLVSFLDNVYHYGAALEDPMAGHDLQAPGWLRRVMLNFNYHATHHRRPTAPWTALPTLARASGARPAGSILPAALRQLRGPIPEGALPKAERGRGRAAVAEASQESFASG